MILEKQTESHILEEGTTQESIGMSLDLDSAQILMQMLSKNLYSDSIGSTVRECASNALDSHRRAGVDKPIVVSFGRNADDGYDFCVEDFGIGLDADDVRNIISKYGKSTKRDSNTELGMMGLGFKAPLAYSSSFYFVCRKDGVERKYMMYEGEDVNTIDLLYEAPTTEDNGVKIIVPVKWQDRRDFIDKIQIQLAYFESVYFNADEVKNDFLIHRNDIFQFSELAKDKNLHICLDNVYYPLDFEKLGISAIKIPVALRFSLNDGLFPTPNRESIRYTQESKKIITDKIASLADYMVEKYNESITDSVNIKTVFDYYSNSSKRVSILDKNCEIDELLKFSAIKIQEPKIEGIDNLNLKTLHRHKDYILSEYEVKYSLSRNTIRECKDYYDKRITISSLDSNHYYTFTGTLGGNKRAYLKEKFPTSNYNSSKYFFSKKVLNFSLGNRLSQGYKSYYEILELSKQPKDKWRDCINEFVKIQTMFLNTMENADDIQIPQQWLDARKKVAKSSVATGRKDANGKRIIKLQGEAVGKIAVDLERYNDGRKCKFVPHTIKLEDVSKNKYLTVYTSHDNFIKLDPLYKIFEKQKIKFMTFSSREMNVLEKIEIHNLITYEKFMEGKNKPFKRVVTANLIHQLTKKYSSTFSYVNTLNGQCTDLYKKLVLLDNYQRSEHVYCSEDIAVTMLEVAQEYNLYDFEIYHIYKEVKEIFEKLPFLNTLMTYSSNYSTGDAVMKSIVDLMKYYKHKVDLNKYHLRIDEEIVEPITDELISELAD
jgi:hypothetical protein